MKEVNHKVLVIEDDPDILENISEILELEGYAALRAGDGKMGLALAVSEKPDIILCDILLPGISGFQVLEILKMHEDTANIPFIVLSAKSAISDYDKALSLGADGYVTKPYSSVEMLSSIENCLQSRGCCLQKVKRPLLSKAAEDIRNEFENALECLFSHSRHLRTRFEFLDDKNRRDLIDKIFYCSHRLNILLNDYIYYAGLFNIDSSLVKTEMKPTISPKSLIMKNYNDYRSKFGGRNEVRFNLADSKIRIKEEHFDKVASEMMDMAFSIADSDNPVGISSVVRNGIYIITVENERADKIMPAGSFLEERRSRAGKMKDLPVNSMGMHIVQRISDLYGASFEIDGNRNNSLKMSFKVNVAG